MWMDLVCPWCYIGRANLEKAIAQSGQDVEVVYRSFLLDPDAPATPVPTVEHLAHKYGGGREQAMQMMQQVSEIAESAGLVCNLENSLTGRTVDAHRLMHYATSVGKQERLAEQLLTAHFADNESIFDVVSLTELAVRAGLDKQAVEQVLASDAYLEDVAADVELSRRYGITGVPFFAIDDRLGVSGAQPPEVLVSAIEQARATQ